MERENWEKYRKEFPITENLIYMNNAAVSPPSTRVLEAIDRIAKAYSFNGTNCREEIVNEEMNTRQAPSMEQTAERKSSTRK